ncbi:NUDIX domain-containing protein [Aestuariibius sp. 2305UL40-4]|uniref:NUDIX domain-containing protein n=1 Tax=Aestuariibius violaceus TaxID=3234132 RepID=UPI00347130B1
MLRPAGGRLEILAFRHPLAGLQLVKGTIEAGEDPGAAACRELAEECGLVAVGPPVFLFDSSDLPDADRWFFYLCPVEGVLEDRWDFETADDGGQRFRFFWHGLEDDLSDEWHPLFVEVFSKLLPVLKALVAEP